MTIFTALPADLPAPVNDGACDHLVGCRLPAVRLSSTRGGPIDLSALPRALAVIFAYPMTGRPGVALPEGWDEIPGARGCTPQNCAFRDLYQDFAKHGVPIFAVSTQTNEYQREMVERLHLPYPVLSDADFRLTDALRLPTLTVDGMRLIRRLTLIVKARVIEHVFYPVFPPDRSAEEALNWLTTNG